VAGGIASLSLNTYDAAHPGSFAGTEIYTNQSFTRGSGLEFDARVRTDAMPSGFVTSFFTYVFNADSTSDEMDFEVLSKQINANPVPPSAGQPIDLTTFHNWTGDPNDYFDGIHHTASTPTVAGLNLNDFNTFTIRWLPDHTEWLINGVLVASTTEALADSPMPIHMNFWAPDNSWSDAYNAAEQPTTNPLANQSYFYDVDYVSVETIPEPPSALLLALGIGGLAGGRVIRRWFGQAMR
jgi:beta-glucanase (GH16 family)